MSSAQFSINRVTDAQRPQTKHHESLLSPGNQPSLAHNVIISHPRDDISQGARRLNQQRNSKRNTFSVIDLVDDEPISRRAARRLRAEERKNAQSNSQQQQPLLDTTQLQSEPLEAGLDSNSTPFVNPNAPRPKYMDREERTIRIYSARYTTDPSANHPNSTRQNPRRSHPQAPAPFTSSVPPWSDRERPETTKRGIRYPAPALASLFSNPWDPSDHNDTDSAHGNPNRLRDPHVEVQRHAISSHQVQSTSSTAQGSWEHGPPSWLRANKNPPCSICLDIPDEFPRLPPTCRCMHIPKACAPCLEQYISSAVRSQGLTTLTCPDPDCRRVMEYEDVLRGAKNDRACLDRYEALLLRRTLEKEPNFVWCKSPTCNWGQVHESGVAAPIVICQVCRARSCFTHDVPWHTGLTCEQYTTQRVQLEMQDRASEAYIEQHAKRCPNTSCRRPIEKTDGCDHMTCHPTLGCGHEFCWVCLADHKIIFREGNHRHEPTCLHYRPQVPTLGLGNTPFEVHQEQVHFQPGGLLRQMLERFFGLH